MEPTIKGIFTSYSIEYVINQIGNQRVQNLLSNPSIYHNFLKFSQNGNPSIGKGTLYVLNQILEYFQNDLEVILIIYNASKNFNENNYYDAKRQSQDREEYLNLINSLIEKYPDKSEMYVSQSLNSFWIDFHFLYSTLIKLLLKKREEFAIISKPIIGKFFFTKNKFQNDFFKFEVKTRRQPRSGKYLSLKTNNLGISDFFDLISVNTSEEIYKFKIFYNDYSLFINNDIIEIKLDTTIDINKLNASNIEKYNLDSWIYEMINNYIFNLEKISNSIYIDFRQPIGSGFLDNAIRFYKNNEQEIEKIEQLNNAFPRSWRPM